MPIHLRRRSVSMLSQSALSGARIFCCSTVSSAHAGRAGALALEAGLAAGLAAALALRLRSVSTGGSASAGAVSSTASTSQARIIAPPRASSASFGSRDRGRRRSAGRRSAAANRSPRARRHAGSAASYRARRRWRPARRAESARAARTRPSPHRPPRCRPRRAPAPARGAGGRARAHGPASGARRLQSVPGFPDSEAGAVAVRSCLYVQRDASRPKRHLQSVRGPGAVRFHAALRAVHRPRGVGHVQFFPITQNESFPLTFWQAVYLLPNNFKHLSLLKLRRRGGLRARIIGFEHVALVVLVGTERGEQRGPRRAHFLAPVPVADRVLHDAVEQRGQLGRRQVPVLFREAQHGVLHDIERGFLVAHGEHCLLECALLDALQERGKLATGCQGGPSVVWPPMVSKGARAKDAAQLDRAASTFYSSMLYLMDRAKTTTLTGAEIVVRCLQEEGVEYVF